MNNKYIKTTQNRKLEAKFFELFQVLHPVEKEAYKLEFSKKWKIYDVFHVSLLKQNNTRKRQADKNIIWLEFESSNNKEYKVEAIQESAVYVREAESGKLLGLYYLVLWKGYSKEKNTWKLTLAVQHLKRMINFFYKDHLDKTPATSAPVNTALLIAWPTVRLTKPTEPAK